jgi:drug/metabolite transporter (DMT)-like permease
MNQKRFSVTDLILLAVVIIWGGYFTVGKIALQEVDPTTFAALRTILAVPVLLLILGVKEKGLHFDKRDIIAFAISGFLGQFLNRLSFSYGLNFTSASNAAILWAITPVFTALLSALFRIERVTLRSAGGIFLAFTGVFLVIKGDWAPVDLSKTALWGDLLILGATLSWSCFTIYAKHLLREHSTLHLTTWSSVFGASFMVPFILKPLSQGTLFHYSLKAWLCILYVAIMANVIAQLGWVTGISRIGPTKTAVYQNLVPVVGVSLAAVVLMESILPMDVIGTILVIAGVCLTRFG